MSDLLTAGIDAALLLTVILSQFPSRTLLFVVDKEPALRVHRSLCLDRDRFINCILAVTPVSTGSALNAARWHAICVLFLTHLKQQLVLRGSMR